MTEDEYAIVSKKEFLTLKKELERLKRNPLEGSESGETLQASIDNLNKSLNVMLEVFKQAADDLKLEEHDSDTLFKQMGPLTDKIDTLIDQNQKIAKGIVAIADMVKEKLEEIEKKQDERPKLPPLGGGPRPPAPSRGPPSYGPPPGPSFGSPMGPPSFGGPDGMDDLPPLTPPGAPQMGSFPPPKKDIMGGLMR